MGEFHSLLDASYKLMMVAGLLSGAGLFIWRAISFFNSAQESLRAIPQLVQGQNETTNAVSAINETLERHIQHTESQIKNINLELIRLKSAKSSNGPC